MEARTNIENLYNARKAAIDFFDEYTSRASEARRQANPSKVANSSCTNKSR